LVYGETSSYLAARINRDHPSAQGAARWTQARIGAALGVAQQTVALWFAADISNTSNGKAYKPPKPKDKRVKVGTATSNASNGKASKPPKPKDAQKAGTVRHRPRVGGPPGHCGIPQAACGGGAKAVAGLCAVCAPRAGGRRRKGRFKSAAHSRETA
jgi:hypothetical protein